MVEPDRYGVVGSPIGHSRSPFIHAHFAAANSQSMIYSAYDVPSTKFPIWVKDFFAQGGRGLNVTVPHKESALLIADRLSERARQAGAVNTLVPEPSGKLLGDNTDGTGWIADLEVRGVSLRDRDVLILGAGGATRGILGPLLAQQPARITIANRHIERAAELVARFAQEAARNHSAFRAISLGDLVDDAAARLTPVDLVVQATSLGLDGRTPALSDALIAAHTIAYDLAYAEAAIPFCDWARSRGARQVFDGIGMLIEQAAESFRLWRGVRPDTRALRLELAGHSSLRNTP